MPQLCPASEETVDISSNVTERCATLPNETGPQGDCSIWNRTAQPVMPRWSPGRACAVQQEQSQGCCFVFGVPAQDLCEAPASLFEVLRVRCQPKPGAENEGAGAAEVSDIEASWKSAEFIKAHLAVYLIRKRPAVYRTEGPTSTQIQDRCMFAYLPWQAVTKPIAQTPSSRWAATAYSISYYRINNIDITLLAKYRMMDDGVSPLGRPPPRMIESIPWFTLLSERVQKQSDGLG